MINFALMINVLGSSFDEAYMRFSAREEQQLKEQLVVELHSGGFECNLGKSSISEAETLVSEKGEAEPMLPGKFDPVLTFPETKSLPPIPESPRSHISSRTTDRCKPKELTLMLSKVLSQLIEHEFEIQKTSGYGKLYQPMIELRKLLNDEIELSSK